MTPSFSLVTADGAPPPARCLLFLHGILGRGSNLRTVARRIVAARPRWAIALVDLRMHGASQGFPGPHTVEAAARDLLSLDAALPAPVAGVLGHSFGGKVALESLRLRAGTTPLSHVIDVDASPSARPLAEERAAAAGTTLQVVELLEGLPPLLPSRQALVERAVAAGIERGLGEWLAMNLAPRDGGMGLILDMTAVRAMLEDYLGRDLWPVVEAVPPGARLDVVIGERGGAFTAEDRRRLARAEAAQPGRLVAHALPTGHWVHAEDPEGLAAIVIGALAPG